jgi:proteasome lid subunit RPN8/RPN11
MSKEAMSKVIDHVKSVPDKEVIGVLIGKMDDDILIVEDALSGDMIEDEKKVVMPGETLARIADDIVNKKVKGNIVGWYHSHPGYGVFMSEVDNDTQSKLQQFSPYVVALVSDSSTGEFKFFSHDEKSKVAQTLANSQVHFYGPGEASVPENLRKGAIQPRPPPTPPPSVVPAPRQPLTRRQIYALISLVVIIAAVVTGVLLIIGLSGPSGSLKIDHNPVTSGLIGNDVKLIANATGGVGGVKDVIISYKLSKDAVWKNDNMLLISKESNSYSYTIRGGDVTGNLDYYITASDISGNKVTTPTATIVIGDFEIDTSNSQLTVYVGQSKTTTLVVRSINDFSSSVFLEAPDRPSVVASVSFSPQQVTPSKGGEATSTMKVTLVPSANTGEYPLTIQARYGQVTRSMTITVLVSGFDISASPSSVTVQKGKTAIYTVTLDIKKGFTDAISFDITGLPSRGIDQTRILVSNKKIATQGITTLTMEIVTKSDASAGTYNLNIVATGGGITQQETVTLIIQ